MKLVGHRIRIAVLLLVLSLVGLASGMLADWLDVPQLFNSSASANVQGQAATLNENCTVSILNRTVQVNPDGSFEIANIPADAGLVRVTIVCIDNGMTTGGRSEFFAPIKNGTIVIGDIPLGNIPPSPESLSVSAIPTILNAPGDNSQITVFAKFPDGSAEDVTPRSEGTTYVSSNPDIAMVDDDGLVTAGSTSGNAFMSVRHDGLLGTIRLSVILDDDSDGDGMPNDYEDTHPCLDSNVLDNTADPDGDGLTNIQEFNLGIDPCFPDTDGDGLNDGDEVGRGTLPNSPDSDLDGLTDGEEVFTFASDPLSPDSDSDGLPDGVEVALVGNAFSANPFADNDGDGLSNIDEIQIFTDPTDFDTDDDGLGDGEEVSNGTDPLVPDSQAPNISVVNPTDGDTLVEGETIDFSVDATDDGRVANVEFLVDGQIITNDGTAPFEVSFTVPTGVIELTFGAVATDTNNNVGRSADISVSVIPDPLTTVVGRVVDLSNNPVPGANVNLNILPNASSTTNSLGTFQFTGVPTIRGNIAASATATVNGELLQGTSGAVPPVLGGVTDTGDTVITQAQFENDLGSGLNQVDDDFDFVNFGFNFPFFDQSYSGVYVTSNGRLGFSFGDRFWVESLNEVNDQPTIAPYFDDLNPFTGGDVFINQHPDRLVITWFNLPEFVSFGSNTIQAILFSNGRIQFGYNGLTSADALVGIFPGGSSAFNESDFTVDTPFSTSGIEPIFDQFFSSDLFDMDGGFLLFIPNTSGGYDVTFIPTVPGIAATLEATLGAGLTEANSAKTPVDVDVKPTK